MVNFLILSLMLEAILFINDQNSVVARMLVNGIVVLSSQCDRTADTLNIYSFDVQSINMLTMCSYFTVVGVLFSL